MEKIGLYIHIPFCNHICTYCDFVKRVSNDNVKENYFLALCNEIETKKQIFLDYQIRTIYIGGGTPSSISMKNLEKLFLKLSMYIDLSSLEEFTFECNIEDISEELGSLLAKYHINRVSIGIESLNKAILRIIGRTNNNYSDICRKMQILRDFGLKNVNFDYIYGIEPSDLNSTINDLNQLIALKPTHISCYSLILEENTILYHNYLKGNFKLMDEDKEAEIYQEIIKFLHQNGYNQYEISNFSLSGYESAHNIIYWSNEEYLGIGLASSSYLNNCRFKNIDSLKEYLKFYSDNEKLKLPLNEVFLKTITEKEILNIKSKMDYEIILGLRMVKGINLNKFNNKYHNSIDKFYPEITNLIQKEYLETNGNYLRISPKFLYLQNQILLKILN